MILERLVVSYLDWRRWLKMPRQLKEIRNFNIGTITNADMREVSGEAASNSQGIDPNAPNGVLRGNLLDKYKKC